MAEHLIDQRLAELEADPRSLERGLRLAGLRVRYPHSEELRRALSILRGSESVGDPTREEYLQLIDWQDHLSSTGLTVREYLAELDAGRAAVIEDGELLAGHRGTDPVAGYSPPTLRGDDESR